MSRYERFIRRYGIKYKRDENDPNLIHLELASRNFERMINVLLWKEWWIVFRDHEDQTRKVWRQGRQAGHEQTWKDFIEEARKGWFKDMGAEE